MNYFVIAADGQKYGPADVNTLKHWAQEGRVNSTTMLEDAMTGQILSATQVAGLIIVPMGQPGPTGPNYQYPPTTQYPRGPGGMVGGFDNGDSDLKTAWTLAIIGVICGFLMGVCCVVFSIFNVFSILGIVYSTNAKKKGNTNTQGALICSIAGLIVGPVIAAIFWIGMQSLK